jgi:hypothetical protein
MKNILRLSILLLATLILLSLTGCVSPSFEDEGLVVGDPSYRLESGEKINTDLTIIGGNATLDENSTVNGDVTVIGGSVTMGGKVNGSVSVIGGYVYLDSSADVTGDLVTLGGTVRRDAAARVEGSEVNNSPWRVPAMRTLPFNITFDPITGPLMAFFQALALAALAIVMQLFAAPMMERTGRAALAQPIVSGGVGLLTVVVAPALLIILAITIILLPLSLLGILAVGIAVLFGWLSLGLMLGRQMAVWLKQPWSDPVNAGVGTLALSLLSSMLNLIPCLGWLANALIWFIALGTAILTRFGMQSYPAMSAPRPAAPYTPPAVPVYAAEPVRETPPPAVETNSSTSEPDKPA